MLRKMALSLQQTKNRTRTSGYMKLLIGVVAAFLISSCEPDLDVLVVVDNPVQTYFDRFVDEAAIRGIDVAYATSQVEARIGEIEEQNVIGQCSWNQHHQHSIVLEQDYWRNATDLQREFLVFHELGHCVIGRGHRDDSDANGYCMSIMSSGTGECRVVYNQANRERLLNELFSD